MGPVHRRYGPDIAFLDKAVDRLFRGYPIDGRRTALAGFSDGASYALSLGLANGAMFSDLLGFSPGFVAPSSTDDAPRIFISHGREDRALPIERCGRRVAAQLRSAGRGVLYREFVGGHVVPVEIVAEACQRFAPLPEPPPH